MGASLVARMRRYAWLWGPVLVLGIVGVVMAHRWTRGPFGRYQVLTIPPERETELGEMLCPHVLEQGEVIADGPLVELVGRIGARLAAGTQNEYVMRVLKLQPPRWAWEFHVVRGDQPWAVCLPGGKVAVSTGLVPVAETEAGLTMILGHAIGHALGHHGAEQLAHEPLLAGYARGEACTLEELDPAQQQALFGVFGAGPAVGVRTSFSKQQELEADRIGLLLAAFAGHDPHGAEAIWQHTEERAAEHGDSAYRCVHYRHEYRGRDLHRWVPESLPAYLVFSTPQDPQRRLPSP
jgi:metalloendopeptidase OMA1, mitochondrial